MRTAYLAAGTLLATLTTLPLARANLLTNPSFEQINLAATPVNPYGFVTLHPGATSLNGWAVSGSTVDVIPSTYWQSAAGAWSVDLTGTPGVGALTQVIATSPGTTYQLTFNLSANPENLTQEAALAKKLRVSIMSAGNILLEQANYYTPVATRTKSNMQYLSETLFFTANSTATAISFAAMAPLNTNSAGLYTGPVIDNLDLEQFSLTLPPAPVPEPASLALLGLGAAALVSRRRAASHA